MFKTNSRFAALMENSSASSNQNNYSRSRDRMYNRNLRQSSFTETSPLLKKNVVQEMSFPELETTKSMKDKENINSKNFAQIVKTVPKACDTKTDIIPDGWVRITREKQMQNINVSYGDNYSSQIPKNQEISQELSEEKKKEDILHLMKSLSYLHYTRTKEYIDMWGIDEWEEQFMFKTDYGYSSETDTEEENSNDDVW